MDLFMGSVILLAAVGDLRMLVRGISGRRRIARHLWPCALGGLWPQVPSSWGSNRYFPPWLRGSPVLLVPALLPLVLLIL
jgi:hypothetical protein